MCGSLSTKKLGSYTFNVRKNSIRRQLGNMISIINIDSKTKTMQVILNTSDSKDTGQGKKAVNDCITV